MGYGDVAAHGNPVIHTPHSPVTLPNPSSADEYKHKADLGTAFFFTAIGKFDAQLGRPRATLTEEGLARDSESFLSSSDWYLPNLPWNHSMVAAGPSAAGDWQIRAARAGTYRFEVRRWPREADTELAGVPAIQTTVDAWDAHGPKPDLLYGNEHTKFKKLPVASVRLTVGEKTHTLPAATGAKEVSFDLEMATSRSYPVKAELLDGSGKTIAGGYYVYCRRESR